MQLQQRRDGGLCCDGLLVDSSALISATSGLAACGCEPMVDDHWRVGLARRIDPWQFGCDNPSIGNCIYATSPCRPIPIDTLVSLDYRMKLSSGLSCAWLQ